MIGALICDIGLDNIICFADPVLGVVYPPFITVVVLLIFRKQIRLREVYQGAAVGALVGGLVVELAVTNVATIVPLEMLPLSRWFLAGLPLPLPVLWSDLLGGLPGGER